MYNEPLSKQQIIWEYPQKDKRIEFAVFDSEKDTYHNIKSINFDSIRDHSYINIQGKNVKRTVKIKDCNKVLTFSQEDEDSNDIEIEEIVAEHIYTNCVVLF